MDKCTLYKDESDNRPLKCEYIDGMQRCYAETVCGPDAYDRGYAAGVAAERATMMAFIERQITEDLEIEGIQVENHRVKDANKCAGRLEAWKVIQDKLRYAK